MPLTVPFVPTGMNAGVATSPWAVLRTPARASPSVAANVKPTGRPVAWERVEGGGRARPRGGGGQSGLRRGVVGGGGGGGGGGGRGGPPPPSRRRGLVGETRFPPRERAKGERRSQDEHGVAERVEAITLFDRETIEAPRLLHSREGHHEREESRAR